MVDVIQDLWAERVEAKRMRDFGAVDAIRGELMEEYNVNINDRNREWSVGGGGGGGTLVKSNEVLIVIGRMKNHLVSVRRKN